MPKNTPTRAIDIITAKYSGISGIGAASALATGGVTDHGQLTGLTRDDHLHYLTADRGALYFVPLARTVSPGSGLSGGGALSANISLAVDATVARNTWPVIAGLGLTDGGNLAAAGVTLNVGVSGLGLSVGANAVVLTSSSNPGAAAAILASDGSGALTLQEFNVGAAMTFKGTNAVATEPDLTFATNALVVAQDSIYLGIDSDASGTGAAFVWGMNATAAPFSAANELMRLTETGRLGVGVGAPSYALDVAGDGRFTTSVLTPTLTTASGALTIAATTDVLLQPASNLVKLQSSVNLQSHNYASQVTGMRVTNDGQGDFRYLFADEMHVKLFIADLEQALAGGQIIAKSVTTLPATWLAVGRGSTGTITVRDLPSAPSMAVFQDGDVIGVRNYSRSGGSLIIGDVFGTVSGYTDNHDGTQTWAFTRPGSTGAGSGSLASSTPIPKDTIVIDYGVSGNGYHEISAIDGMYGANSPYNQVVTWSGGSPSATAAKTIRTRLGNLYGVFSIAGEFGLYAGDGSADTNQYLRISNQGVRLNNIPLQLWAGSPATQRVNIDATGTDVWFKNDAGVTKLSWNGSTLAIDGTVTANDGAIGGWTLGSSTLTGTNVRLVSGASSRVEVGNYAITDSGDPLYGTVAGIYTGATAAATVLWAGKVAGQRGTAPFRVTLGGTLTATDVKITAGGSGTKDSDLNGWNIDSTEIVGQASGVDQVVLTTSGKITAGAGKAMLDADGVKLTGGTSLWQQGTALEWYATPSTKTTLYGRLGVFRYNTGLDTTRLYLQAKQVGTDPADIMLETLNAAGAFVSSLRLSATGLEFSGNIVYHAGNLTPANYAPLLNPVFSGTPKVGASAIWHEGNDGSLSGLDADKVDNLHASSFALLSGAAFTGDISTSGAIGGSWTQIGTYAARYKKFGDMVIFQGTVTASGTGSFTAGTLAAGYRPPNTIYLSVLNANKNVQKITINTTGTIVFDAHEASIAVSLDNIQFSVTAF